MRLARLHYDGWGFRETDPDRAYALYDQGCQLAKALGEPWWTLFYAHWRLGALLYFKLDFRDVIRPAVEAVLEVRKPQYDPFPFRFAIYYDLITAYFGVDALGYVDPIRQALRSLEQDVPRTGEDDFLLEDLRRVSRWPWTTWTRRSRPRCVRCGWPTMTTRVSAPPTTWFSTMTGFAKWPSNAGTGIGWQSTRRPANGRPGGSITRCISRNFRCGRPCWPCGPATRRRPGGCGPRPFLAARLKRPPSNSWFDALCAWALHENDLPAALRVRDRELATIVDHGRLGYECTCHIERCRLLAKMGRPLDEVLAAGRGAAARLRNPAPELEKLDRAVRGETG